MLWCSGEECADACSFVSQASKRRKTAVDESALHESCNEFSELLRSTFYKNMDRFELYANRNIFVPPSSRLAAQVTTSIAHSRFA